MKQKLEEKWYQVFIPVFPTPQWQSLYAWKAAFEEYKKYIDSETIFIAHSVWPSFVCSVLEHWDISIKSCYFASWFLWNINIPDFDRLNNSFVNTGYNWEKIKNNCGTFYMCHGSDDPYVPLQNARLMGDNLGIEIDIIDWGWHLNSESGYSEFEYLLNKII